MKLTKKLLLLGVAALAGAMTTSAVAHAMPTVFAAAIEFFDSGSNKRVSATNQLPVTAYPTWGADTSATIFTASAATQLSASTKYVVFCTQNVWCDLGTSSVTAAVGERPIPANYPYPLLTSAAESYVAVIASGSGGGRCTFSVDTY